MLAAGSLRAMLLKPYRQNCYSSSRQSLAPIQSESANVYLRFWIVLSTRLSDNRGGRCRLRSVESSVARRSRKMMLDA